MKTRTLKLLAFLISTTFFSGKVFGQAAQADSAVFQASLDKQIANYYIAIGQQSRLYSGKEYYYYDRVIKGTPLFPLNVQSWETGEVTYDGFKYQGVPMMYDIYQDIVVVLLYNHFSMYSLINDKVKDFSFSGHHFVRINIDTIPNDKSGLTTGFYEQLYAGKCQVVARHAKTIQHNASVENSLETNFLEAHDYFLRKGKTWYKVNSQGALFSVLKDKKPALQKYLKDHNLVFNDNPELALSLLAAYYDRL